MDNGDLLNNIETAILGTLSSPTSGNLEKSSTSSSVWIEEVYNKISLPIKRQKKYVTFSFSPETEDSHRLFTGEMDMILDIPDKSYGIIIINNGFVKEFSMTKLSNIPKRHQALGSFDSVWQIDFIATSTRDLKSQIIQRVVGIKGRKCFVLYPIGTPKEVIRSQGARDRKEVSVNFAICASILEDYLLKQFWHIDISAHTTISTYAKEEDVKFFLDIRKGPFTKTGQRKKVLHWVSGHCRQVGAAKIDISSHLRGLEKFNIGGFNIEITQPFKKTNACQEN